MNKEMRVFVSLVTVLFVSAANWQKSDFWFPDSFENLNTLRPLTQKPVSTTTTSTARTTTRSSSRPVLPVILSAPCSCPFTREYNPVCGKDGKTYGNTGILKCQNVCGNRVQLAFYGVCIAVQG